MTKKSISKKDLDRSKEMTKELKSERVNYFDYILLAIYVILVVMYIYYSASAASNMRSTQNDGNNPYTNVQVDLPSDTKKFRNNRLDAFFVFIFSIIILGWGMDTKLRLHLRFVLFFKIFMVLCLAAALFTFIYYSSYATYDMDQAQKDQKNPWSGDQTLNQKEANYNQSFFNTQISAGVTLILILLYLNIPRS